MFDFSKLTDTLSSLFSGGADAAQNGGLMTAISEAGIDLGQLQGLGPDQIMDALAQNGIDIASFAPDQVQELLGSVGALGEGGLGGLASEWLGGDGPGRES